MLLTRAIAGKLFYLVPVLLLVTLATTVLIDLLPGDPAVTILGLGATPEQVARINAEYGFDRPFYERYAAWVSGAVVGDFGNSLVTSRPVISEIAARLPVTIQLTVMALVLSVLLAIVLALLASVKEGGWFDRVMTALSSGSMSVPSFVAAVVLVYIFAIVLGWAPVAGYRPLRDGLGPNLHFMALPVITMSLLETGFFYRILRGDLATTLREDYILAARAKGLGRGYLLLRHALRPSLFSLMAMVGLSVGRLLGGTVIVETFFAVPGLGQLLVNSVTTLDIPVIQAAVALIAIFYVLINATVDVLYSVVDPRVKLR
ncbi:ABC transporter permease [Microbacterium album]|uniref:Peptide ABC transporter n=1 Tax=Microbacterium album TaxID=2053191 RepID=A0A917IEB9_9MICO|nr:ABC transporter permease [Microbacterium album]GGH41044.1 peptide ABC transporter [Microbacterium album]